MKWIKSFFYYFNRRKHYLHRCRYEPIPVDLLRIDLEKDSDEQLLDYLKNHAGIISIGTGNRIVSILLERIIKEQKDKK